MNRDGTDFFLKLRGGAASCASTPRLLLTLLVGADSVGGQMPGDKECRPISGVTTKLVTGLHN